MIPTIEENPEGLHSRYIVTKANGEPVDPEAEYFVLRVDKGAGDKAHRVACLRALQAYADQIERSIPGLAKDLRERYELCPAFVSAWHYLAAETYGTHVEKGFSRAEINDGEQIALMHSELSEALEGIRKDLWDDKLPHRKMVEVELADVVIRIMNYAFAKDLDVPEAVIQKAAYNKTRPYRHGGKKF